MKTQPRSQPKSQPKSHPKAPPAVEPEARRPVPPELGEARPGGAIQRRVASEERFSIPSVLAVVCAVGSFYAGPFLGALLAVGAIILGVLGAGLAMSSSRRGGVLSVLSIFAGGAGALAAVVKLILLIF